MFLEIGDACHTHFNMAINETKNKEKANKLKYFAFRKRI